MRDRQGEVWENQAGMVVSVLESHLTTAGTLHRCLVLVKADAQLVAEAGTVLEWSETPAQPFETSGSTRLA